jgi:arylsulfatase A-like enzyme
MPLARAALACLLLAGCTRAPEPARPDIVLVVADTLRADRLPFHGHPEDTAPFLAEWAARSLVFERAWSTSSWTSPATASLLTGVYPIQHGVTAGLNVYQRQKRVDDTIELNKIPQELETLPEFLRSLGYRTFGLADNPNIAPDEGFDQGFERLATFEAEGAERMLATLREWSPEIRAARPFFLYLHFMDPHHPYQERAPWYRAPGSDDPLERDRAAYDSEIRHMDEHLRQAFQELDIGPEDVVLFVADHGEEFMDHGHVGHPWQLYSELTRVPFFLHLPGTAPGRVDANVSLIDVLPTLRALLGAPASAQDQGRDLSALAAGSPPFERPLFAQRRTPTAHKQSVVLGGTKYIVTDYDPVLLPDYRQERELYDLAADPLERENLAAERPELAEELDRELRRFEREARRWAAEKSWVRPTEELRALIEQLGYAGGDEPRPFYKKPEKHPQEEPRREGE